VTNYVIIAGKKIDLDDRRMYDYGTVVWQIPRRHPGQVIGWNPNPGREDEVLVRWFTDTLGVFTSSSELADSLIGLPQRDLN
jgi:hypothetical protein